MKILITGGPDPEQEYAPPGTVRDSQRNVNVSFSIKNHGAFYLMGKDGMVITSFTK